MIVAFDLFILFYILIFKICQPHTPQDIPWKKALYKPGFLLVRYFTASLQMGFLHAFLKAPSSSRGRTEIIRQELIMRLVIAVGGYMMGKEIHTNKWWANEQSELERQIHHRRISLIGV